MGLKHFQPNLKQISFWDSFIDATEVSLPVFFLENKSKTQIWNLYKKKKTIRRFSLKRILTLSEVEALPINPRLDCLDGYDVPEDIDDHVQEVKG